MYRKPQSHIQPSPRRHQSESPPLLAHEQSEQALGQNGLVPPTNLVTEGIDDVEMPLLERYGLALRDNVLALESDRGPLGCMCGMAELEGQGPGAAALLEQLVEAEPVGPGPGGLGEPGRGRGERLAVVVVVAFAVTRRVGVLLVGFHVGLRLGLELGRLLGLLGVEVLAPRGEAGAVGARLHQCQRGESAAGELDDASGVFGFRGERRHDFVGDASRSGRGLSGGTSKLDSSWLRREVSASSGRLSATAPTLCTDWLLTRGIFGAGCVELEAKRELLDLPASGVKFFFWGICVRAGRSGVDGEVGWLCCSPRSPTTGWDGAAREKRSTRRWVLGWKAF